MSPALRRFLSDRHGNIVLAQPPNVPIVAWAVLSVAAWLLPHGRAEDVVAFFASAFLFTWAWMELADGVTPARRTLGGLVLASMLVWRIVATG